MEIDETTTTDYNPTLAFVLHKSQAGGYVESHKIKDGKILGGKPLSIETIRSLKGLMDSLDIKSHTAMRGFVPNNVLYIDSDKISPKLVWWTDKSWKLMRFSQEIGIEKINVEVPKLLWVYTSEGTQVFAIKKADPYAKVYNAPFWNVNESGDVCFGNVNNKPDLSHIAGAITSIEHNFFNSEFTPHYDFKDKYKTPIRDLWEGKDNCSWNKENQKNLMLNSQYETVNRLFS